MSRKALIVAVVVGIIITIGGSIFIFGRKESPPQIQSRDNQDTSVSVLPNGWQLIKSGPLRVSIEVPPAWTVGHVNGNIEAILGDGENGELALGGELIIYSYDNPADLTAEAWFNKKGVSNFSKIVKNGVEGVSYETKAVEKYYKDGNSQARFIENTYILGNIFSRQGKIIEATCGLSGPNYRTMIPTCEELIKSLQFIQ